MNQNSIQTKLYPPLLTLAISAGFCEFLTRRGILSDFIVPAPSQVCRALISEQGVLLEGFLSTLSSSCIGLLLSFIIGSSVASLLATFNFLRRAIYPYAAFFQTMPIIAIAPLLVIWFGFGKPTVISSSFIVSVFPIITSTLAGFESIDPQFIDLFQFYQASKVDYFLKLKLPFALPYIFSGLRIAAGLAVIGAIVGEFIGGGGLGSLIDSARTQQRVDIVFAAVLMSSLLGLIFISLINYLSWLLLHYWYGSEQNSFEINVR